MHIVSVQIQSLQMREIEQLVLDFSEIQIAEVKPFQVVVVPHNDF